MLAYVDSSVLLSFVLNEKHQLSEFRQISYAVSSELIRIESMRTLDRYRLRGGLTENEYVTRVHLMHTLLHDFELVLLSSPILNRASQSFPTTIGTLDALHLSTCLLYQEKENKTLVLCTHDEALKRAGLAMELEVLG